MAVIRPREVPLKPEELRILDWNVTVVGGQVKEIVIRLSDGLGEYWRVVKLLRLLRNPREYAQIETALEIHRDFVLAATRRRREARLVLLAVNSERLGLIWCYGVAATAEDLEEARRIAEECFAALMAGFRGHYRQALVRPLTAEEGEEINRIFMISGKSLVIKGIPEPRDSYTRPQSDLIGFRVGRRMIEMLEEMVRALGEDEYAYIVLAEAMAPEKVKALLRKVADLATKYSDFTESAYVGFTFSIPIGFTLGRAYGEQLASAHTHGRAHSTTDGKAASSSSGDTSASAQGVTVSESHSRSESVQRNLTVSQAHTRGRAHTHTESEGVAESLAYTYGTAHSTAHTRGESYSTSHTVGRAESEGVQVTEGRAHTVGHGLTHSASHTEGLAHTSGWSRSHSRSESVGEQWSDGMARTESLQQTQSVQYGRSVERGRSVSEGFSASRTESFQTSQSVSRSHVETASHSTTQGITRSHTTGRTESWGTTRSAGSSWSSGGSYAWQRSITEGTSRSETTGTSQTAGTSRSLSLSHGGFSSQSQGQSSTQGSSQGWQAGGGIYAGLPFVHGGGSLNRYQGTNQSQTQSQSATQGENWQVGHSYGSQQSTTQSQSTTLGTSRSVSESYGGGYHWSSGGFSSSGYTHERGVSVSDTVARSRSVTTGSSVADGVTTGQSVSRGRSLTQGRSITYGRSVSLGESLSTGRSVSRGQSISVSRTTGGSRGWTVGESYGLSGSRTESEADTRGVSRSLSEADTASRSVGRSLTHTRSESWTEGRTVSRSTTVTDTVSRSVTKGRSVSRQVSEGTTESEAVTDGRSVGLANTVGLAEGYAVSRQLSGSRSDSRQGGWSESRSVGDSVSRSEAVSRGLSRSSSSAVVAGIWPGLSMGYTRQRIDEARRLLYEVIKIEEQRYVEMASHGGYYVMGVIIAPKEETIAKAEATILGAFAPTRLIPHPLKAVRGDSRILAAAKAFAFDLREAPSKSDLDPYAFLNVYTSTELAALTHPPRLEAPGLENVAENIPEFRIPPPGEWEVEFGNVISHETGGPVKIRYGIREGELLHALFLGVTRMGKSNAAMLFVERVVERLGARALILDWKKDWRRLLLRIPGRLYALYRGRLPRLKWNPLRPPKGVDPETWRDVVVQWFAMTYGLGPRSYSLLWDQLDKLYESAGVYTVYEEWLSRGGPGPDYPSVPTLADLYERVKEELEELQRDKRVSFDTLDVYRKTLDRLKYFTRGSLKEMFCPEKGVDIGDLLSGAGVTVIEAGELADVHKPFLLGTLAIASFLYRKFSGPSERPELIVIEEAHQIAFDVAKKEVARMLNVTENIFDKMAAESAGFNQYLVMIAQYPSVLGNGVLKNTGLLVSFKLIAETEDYPDVTMVTEMLARDSRLDHRQVKRFLTRLPIGWSVVRKMRTFNLIDTEPVLVKWDLYPVPSASDREVLDALKARGAGKGDEGG